MTEASAISSRRMQPSFLRMGRGYINNLKDVLSITEPQMEAWTTFAEVLRSNRRRLEDAGADQPYGALEHRLAALRCMRSSAAKLFALLDPVQQKLAMRHLPLCCLPKATA
jgi:hypothetical protein